MATHAGPIARGVSPRMLVSSRTTAPGSGTRRTGWVALLGLGLLAGLTAPAPAPAPADRQLVAVLVEGGGAPAVEAAHRLGGSVTARLSVINGFSARVPASAVDDIAALPGVTSVRPDGTLRPMDSEWGDDDTGEGKQASWLSGTWKADHDEGSSFTTTKRTGAQTVWGKSAPSGDKITGRGVGVAVIDTGIAPVEGLITPGKIINGPDLSFESQISGTRFLDGYGHGTHMAGLIAGRDSDVPVGGEASAKHFVGMAPDAKLVNVKVGTADGGVDVSQVIAGIDWVVRNRASHNIKVLNLSYGTDSQQAPALDPLAHAVESAWRNGITVVVAAGNDGELGPLPLTMPAIDPFVIAVGSSDHRGESDNKRSLLGSWTNSGTTSRRPDVLAPGKSAVSLRVPGSWADRGHPEGLVPGDASQRLFRGTGTSQSAAVVSGAAALLLQRNPALKPDQVKGLLKATAYKLPLETRPAQGAGQIDVKRAVEVLEAGAPAAYTQTWNRSSGLGALEGARGTSHVTDPVTGVELRGEQDIFGAPWDASAWAPTSTAGTAWSGGSWRGGTWSDSSWVSATSWGGIVWNRRTWSGDDWSRRTWSSMVFLRGTWSGDDWSRRTWSSDNWARRTWSTHDAW